MPLTLTDADLMELRKLTEEMRHKDALTIIGFFNAKQRRDQQATASEAAPQMPAHRSANGHADQPRPSAPAG